MNLSMIDMFPQPEKWDLLNNHLKQQLKSEYSFRAFMNPYLACYDVIMGLAQLYAHKRSLVWIKGQSPIFDSVYPHFVREGYNIQTFSYQEFKDQSANMIEFVEKLKKDTLFFFFSEDHPLSGETFDYGELENVLSHKKIFTVSMSHQSHKFRKKSLYPLAARICWYDSEFTGVHFGEKFKVNSLLGSYQNLSYSQQDSLTTWQTKIDHVQNVKEFESEIKKFEASFTAEENYISSVQRIWDRSLLLLKSIHTDELAARLYEKGFTKVYSLSPCHSASVKMFQKWTQGSLSVELLPHLLFLKFDNAKDFPEPSLIKSLIKEIEKDSSWEF